MKTFEQVWDETEGKARIENEAMCKTIILELEQTCHIHFPVKEMNVTYGVFLQAILFNSYYMEYREKLLEIMKRYSINWTNIMFRFINIINQEGILPLEKRMMENAFKTLPYCKMFEKTEQHGYAIETLDGIIEISQLSEVIYYPSLYELLYTNAFMGCCHQAVDECRDYFPNTEVVTSELLTLFGDTMYHSYFKDENTNEVIDLSMNTLYKNNTFDTFYRSRELQKIPSMMLDEYLKILPEEKDGNHYKVLRLAIQNKIKNERES